MKQEHLIVDKSRTSLTVSNDRLKDIKERDPSYKLADLKCIKAIAQAAINVELFTIPLYMVSLYSVKGLHQINSKGSDFYEGRWWPGSAPTGAVFQPGCKQPDLPLTTNEKVFNHVYSVFIEEMLHLQMTQFVAISVLLLRQPCGPQN